MDRLRNLDLGRVVILLLVVIGTATLLTRNQWDWFFASDEPQTQDVTAEQIEIDDVDPVTERLYRVSPDNGSEVSYRVPGAACRQFSCGGGHHNRGSG